MHLSTFRTYIHQVPPSPSIYQGSEVPCDIFSEQSCNPLSVSTMPEMLTIRTPRQSAGKIPPI